MDTTITMEEARGRRPVAALGKLTIVALVGIAVIIGIGMAQSGRLDPQLGGFTVFALLCAGIVATGWRWAPLLGTLVGGLMLAGYVPIIGYILSHPAESSFWLTVLFLPLATVAIAGGIGATVQNYGGGDRRAPRWLPGVLLAVAGVCAGAIAVAAIPAPAATGAGISPQLMAALPSLGAANLRFDQAEIRVKAGETVALRLDNRDTQNHTFDVDELGMHATMNPGQSSVALFKAAAPGSYPFYCAVPGHRQAGMAGTLVVTP